MGLRFRKSVKIAPGVRLNIGKKSVGVSAGVKGYRKSINSSGRVTTSIGTPVAGVSYVKTENFKTKKKKAASNRASSTATAASSSASSPAVAPAPVKVQKAAAQPKEKPPKTTAVLQERPDASFVVFGVVALAGAVFLFASSHVIFSVVAALFGVFCLYSFIHIKRHPEDPRYITEEQLTRWGQLVHSDAKTVSQLQKASVPVYSSFVSNKITAFTNDILNG